MTPKEQDISIERVRELLEYRDGILYWRVRRGGKANVGTEAGSLYNHGYIVVGIDGALLLSHRIVWAMHHGEWPNGNIDHIDGNKTHNNINNLRNVTQLQNGQNRGIRVGSKSGVPGVYKYGSGWGVDIRIMGVRKYLGKYDSVDKAKQAIKDYVDEHYPNFDYFRESLR